MFELRRYPTSGDTLSKTCLLYTSQKELYIGVLENMHIFLPPLAEQYRIVAKIEKLFSSLDNIQKALEV